MRAGLVGIVAGMEQVRGSSDDGGRWRQTRRSEWKRVGDDELEPIP